MCIRGQPFSPITNVIELNRNSRLRDMGATVKIHKWMKVAEFSCVEYYHPLLPTILIIQLKTFRPFFRCTFALIVPVPIGKCNITIVPCDQILRIYQALIVSESIHLLADQVIPELVLYVW